MCRTVIVAALMALVAGAVGCKTHDELVVDVTCGSACPCLVDPEEVEECLRDCSQQLDPADVPDACFTCLLEAGDVCASVVACDPVCPF